MTLDSKTAIYTLIEMAVFIANELEFYKDCKGGTERLENAINEFNASVQMLSIEHNEAFKE